jgi:MOSC domain-containing protein YiiM
VELRIVSVNVGQVRIIGTRNGAPLPSAIGKEPVAADKIAVRALGLDGDVQANLRVHGGVDKAVYAYPADHWSWWDGEHRFACRPASFGENLSTQGAGEDEVRIGDRFAWGDAILEVSQPRSPCHKFAIYAGRDDLGPLMHQSGRCGFYFRVVREGTAPVHGGVLRRIATSDNPSVREAFFAVFARPADMELRRRVAATPALAAAWLPRMDQ